MSIVVQKYGGSSVADVTKIGQVADKVVATRRAGHDVVVVVSAMGKTTDGLLALARQASGEAEPPRRELDMLLSTGERVSMSLLSIAIQARGLDAISFTGSQSGIITNDRHFDARILEVRPHRIEDELARGRIVIVAGYQGMSYRREITTLGRGGSDTTAVALAAALDAERCEIYSDVDGVYSADPRVVPDAVHLPEIDHAVLQEMAECGAKVLNAQAVEWARRAKIAIYARATSDDWNDAAAAPRQTVVRTVAGESERRVRAVVSESNLVLGHLAASVDLGRVVAAAGEAGLALDEATFGPSGGTFVLPLLNVPDWARARAVFIDGAGPGVDLDEGLASVSVVGDGLSATHESLHRFLSTLAALGVAPRALSSGPLRIAAVVAAADVARTTQAVHAAFVR